MIAELRSDDYLQLEDIPIVVVEQGFTAEAPLRAMNRTIDRVIKTAVVFSLQPDFLWENGRTTVRY